MFMAADIVVKAVMVGLVFASVLTWTIWFAKAIELMARAPRCARRSTRWPRRAHGPRRRRLHDQRGRRGRAGGARPTPNCSSSAGAAVADGVKERIASRLERLEAAAGRAMIRGTGILATIGATAPFVGLFGTVWGIMNSFIGISKAQTTNLAVVAPGIAEALLATALGLVAAIPAVVMYNFFSRWIAGYRALHADASAEILRLVSRDLDRGAFEQRPSRRGVERRRVDRHEPASRPRRRALGRDARDQRHAVHRRDPGAADHLHDRGAAGDRRYLGRPAGRQRRTQRRGPTSRCS